MANYQLTTLPVSRHVPFKTVETLFWDPFPGQRSHRLHLKEATYLQTRKPLVGDQLIFQSIRYRENEGKGKWVHQLIDGYTRIEAVYQQLMQRPEQVLLITHVVADYAAAQAHYEMLNNAKAGKKGRHFVQSGVRQASGKDSFSSNLLLKGPLTTAIAHSGVKKGNLTNATASAFRGLDWLDAMGLNRRGETAGMLAAFVAMSVFEPDRHAAKLFISRMNQEVFVPNSAEDQPVVALRQFQAVRRANKTCSGTANVDTIRDYALGCFVHFKEIQKNSDAVFREDLTLGQYLQLCNQK